MYVCMYGINVHITVFDLYRNVYLKLSIWILYICVNV